MRMCRVHIEGVVSHLSVETISAPFYRRFLTPAEPRHRLQPGQSPPALSQSSGGDRVLWRGQSPPAGTESSSRDRVLQPGQSPLGPPAGTESSGGDRVLHLYSPVAMTTASRISAGFSHRR
uniref:Uncharacterized protein n=1 Tax=Amphiprion percula TaxID=161767 RepID=A0A3P8SMP2_AMPPE